MSHHTTSCGAIIISSLILLASCKKEPLLAPPGPDPGPGTSVQIPDATVITATNWVKQDNYSVYVCILYYSFPPDSRVVYLVADHQESAINNSLEYMNGKLSASLNGGLLTMYYVPDVSTAGIPFTSIQIKVKPY